MGVIITLIKVYTIGIPQCKIIHIFSLSPTRDLQIRLFTVYAAAAAAASYECSTFQFKNLNNLSGITL